MLVHTPPSSSYLAGSITGSAAAGYQLHDHNRWNNGTFPVRLSAFKIENHTGTNGRPSETLDIKLELVEKHSDPSAENSCTRSTVDFESYTVEHPETNETETLYYGAWAFVPKNTKSVRVWVRRNNQYELLREVTVNVTADVIVIDSESNIRAKSGEFDHVYYSNATMVVDNKTETAYYGWIRWKSASAPTPSHPPLISPAVGPYPATVPVSLAAHDYGQISDDAPASLFLTTDRQGSNVVATFRLYDVDANEIEVLEQDGMITCAPYAATPSDSKVKVTNRTQENIEIWPEGNPKGAKKLGHDESETFDVPHTDPATGRTHQAALHWDLGGDPKVIIKQDDCGTE